MGTREKEIVTIRSSAAEYLTYVAASGDDEESVEMRYEDENIWLTQKMIATLYNVGVSTINEHIKKVFGDNELQEDVTIRIKIHMSSYSKPLFLPRDTKRGSFRRKQRQKGASFCIKIHDSYN